MKSYALLLGIGVSTSSLLWFNPFASRGQTPATQRADLRNGTLNASSASIADLMGMYTQSDGVSDLKMRARRRTELATTAWTRFLNDQTQLDVQDAGARKQWLSLAAVVGDELPEAVRLQLSAAIIQRYSPSQKADSRTASERLSAYIAVAALDENIKECVAPAIHLAMDNGQLAELSVAQLLDLAHLVAVDPSAGAVLIHIADHSWSQALALHFATEIDGKTLEILRTAAFGGNPSSEWRRAKADEICRFLIGSPNLPTLSSVALEEFKNTITTLEPGSTAPVSIVAQWVGGGKIWQDCDPVAFRHLVELPSGISPAQKDAVATSSPQISIAIKSSIKTWASQSSIGRLNSMQMARDWNFALGKEDARQLADQLLSKTVAAPAMLRQLSPIDVCSLSECLVALATPTTEPSPALLAWLSDLNRPNSWSTDTADLGRGFFAETAIYANAAGQCSPDQLAVTLRVVRKKLIDPGQVLRPDAAKLLSAMAIASNRTQDWVRLLELKIQSTSGEEQVPWLLARAFTSEAAASASDPLAGERWIRQAMAATQSTATRIDLSQLLVQRLVPAGQYAEADRLLAQASKWAQSADDSHRLQAYSEQLSQIRHFAQREQAANELVLQRQQLSGELKFYQSRLEDARKRGRTAADLASISNVISVVEKKLASVESDGDQR